MHIIVAGVAIVLIVNVVLAIIVIARRAQPGSWLLVLLLSGTTGAGAIAAVSLLVPGDVSRFVDVGLIFTALAAISSVVAATAQRRRLSESAELTAANHAPHAENAARNAPGSDDSG